MQFSPCTQTPSPHLAWRLPFVPGNPVVQVRGSWPQFQYRIACGSWARSKRPTFGHKCRRHRQSPGHVAQFSPPEQTPVATAHVGHALSTGVAALTSGAHAAAPVATVGTALLAGALLGAACVVVTDLLTGSASAVHGAVAAVLLGGLTAVDPAPDLGHALAVGATDLARARPTGASASVVAALLARARWRAALPRGRTL